ncbi:MAG: hypothetical protein V1738_03700, partial [Patescibacteria group bacterium]
PDPYPERPVRFSIANCDTNKYCIKNLARNELQALYKRLGYFEQMTWGQAVQMPHDKGISIDKKEGVVTQLLSQRLSGLTYGHLRIPSTDSNTRVFIGRDRDLAKILLIDRTGELQH